jgi:hypothetical protein
MSHDCTYPGSAFMSGRIEEFILPFELDRT